MEQAFSTGIAQSNPLSLERVAQALAEGVITSRELVEQCLARIEEGNDASGHAFLSVRAEQARQEADLADRMRNTDMARGRFLGIPISVKDLFDLKGEVTKAGSHVLRSSPPAKEDALAVARLRRAGFIVIGRTNMTEFAFSGLGLNPAFGNPLTPWDRESGRIAGGSTAGGAVSVAERMAFGAIGTDTGGSTRIPAAFCGIVGFKPTVGTISDAGIIPLSHTLDSAGAIAADVASCAALHSIMATGEETYPLGPDQAAISGLRIGVPQSVVLDDMDDNVAQAFEGALRFLSSQGAQIVETPMTSFSWIAGINAKGGFTAAESYAWHADRIRDHEGKYDPRVLSRILRGKEQSASDYITLLNQRRDLIEAFESEAAAFDLLAFPTVPFIPPLVASLIRDDAHYSRINLLALRNSTTINMVDGCAVSLPISRPGEAPVGLTLAKGHSSDMALLRMAATIEAALGAARL